MVSIISTPETVALASFPASRICTRVILTRRAEMYLEKPTLTATDATPIKVRGRL